MTLLKSIFRCLALLSGLVVFLAFPCFYFCWFAFHSPAPGGEEYASFWSEQFRAEIQEYPVARGVAVPQGPEARKPTRVTRVVLATAYNPLGSQTDSTPDLCAWGDRVKPGIIAVSRDLEELGLTRGRRVYVEGVGPMVVMDRMHDRKTNQIDIFMHSLEDAVSFGVQEVKIRWELSPAHKNSRQEQPT